MIIGDSMIEKIDGYLVTGSSNYKYLMKVRPFLAAKIVDMFDYVKPIRRDLHSEAYVIYINTYDRTTDKTPDEIWSEILRLIKEFKTDKNKIVVSNVVLMVDTNNTKFKKKHSA